ncbi:MAG: hypothetical protein COS72_04470 [Candidatus Moranbacteria bacterium CG06_land_8_20_14_3_00_43_56]|nr:MAG: hypothetical protein COS72_04470 [Candidatus Moranbacteria bacterium CG06_land_8_20_14_3_00_43_56]PIV84296.1 MAG: hypothetical protein COW51_00890 [Candidatus Moranbacteria bacterium CG17_big_fil_post_rev_8_21_14_2_50_44_12]PIW93062.1 MAG: hypothetical protein COZ87_03380 [Candidatus Moranbacteria bacterium CG_4_8_14_3_um_filter_43_15]PJA85852.1 MAG: hypothetical protein CO142_02640 [Candidatus Moranbacteria bacterium CG_4_9_14_3_um_filter_44_28]
MAFSKKIIIIIIAIILIVATSVLFIINKTKKSSETVLKTNGGEAQNIPMLPGAQLAKSPDPSEIKNSVEQGLKDTQTNSSQISEKSYKNSAGQVISLSDFANANEVKIEAGVLQNSSQKDYTTFSCAKEKNECPAIGIMLQLRRDVDPQQYQQMFSKMNGDMKKWESTIFSDLSPLFFPGESFSREPKFNVSKYTTSNKVNTIQVRYANLIAASGKNFSIDWGFLNDNVFISNDRECLRRELDQNADAYEP